MSNSRQMVRSGRRDLTTTRFTRSTVSETPSYRQRRRREEHEMALGHVLQLVHSLSEVISPLKAVAGGAVFVMGHRQKVRTNRKNIVILLKSMVLILRMAQEGALRVLAVSRLVADLTPRDAHATKRLAAAEQDFNELCSRLIYFQSHLIQRHSSAVDVVGQRKCQKHGINRIPDQVGRTVLQPMGFLQDASAVPPEREVLRKLPLRSSVPDSTGRITVLDASEPLRRLFNNLADLYKGRIVQLCERKKYFGHYRLPDVIALEIQECHQELRDHVMAYQTDLLEMQTAYQRIMLHMQQRNHEEVIARLRRLEHKVNVKSETSDRARWWDQLAKNIFN
ncbi:hypothetical protein FRC02_009550 [Tulasnella sp. 418]|nr:hypothetical protein FRC02_009550 [Tulasnella sp. 418]